MEETVTRLLYDPTLGRLVVLALGLVGIRVAVGVAHRGVTERIQDHSVRYRVRKGIDLASILVAAFFVAVVFSDRLGGFTVAFGVAGAGIAFALHEVIASVAAWVALTFGDYFEPGDRVQLGGIRGDVIDVGILRTTLMECGQWVNADEYSGRTVRVSNSVVFKEPVFNYSADFPFVWDEICVPIRYGSDYRLGRELLGRVAEEVVGEYARNAESAWHDVVRKFIIEKEQVAPGITLHASEHGINLTLRYVVDYKQRRTTKDRLFTRLLEEIDVTQGRVSIAATPQAVDKPAPTEVRVAEDIRVRGIRTVSD